MNKYRKKRLSATRLCVLVLFTLFVAASDRAQTQITAPAAADRSDAISVPSFVSRFRLSPAPSDSCPTPADNARTTIDDGLSKEFDKAWRISGDGVNNREGVVLIFRMLDGRYVGKLQGFTNEYRQFTFRWNPAAIAIVHTHPNGADPKPAAQDKRVAEKYGVPNFTITLNGMYVYDPVTKKTSKVLNGLDWLNLSTCPDELKRWFGE